MAVLNSSTETIKNGFKIILLVDHLGFLQNMRLQLDINQQLGNGRKKQESHEIVL